MTTPAIVHDDKFYLADGDLLIRSEPPQGGSVTVFRVHKAMMAYNSPVFRDMLDLPGDPAGREMHDGAPVVWVTDTADEVQALLAALYDPGAFSIPRWDPNAPENLKLRPVIKLATNYQIDALRQRVINVIEDCWPRPFEEWIRFNTEISVLRKVRLSSDDALVGGKAFVDHVPEPASAIRLARDFDIPSILPFAYYTLAGFHSGLPWYQSNQDNQWNFLRARVLRAARWQLLDANDLLLLIRDREELIASMKSIAQLWGGGCRADLVLFAAVERCRESRPQSTCREKKELVREKWKEAISSYIQNVRNPDPLGMLEKMYDSHLSWCLCQHCAERIMKHIRREQQGIWNQLDRIFKLPVVL